MGEVKPCPFCGSTDIKVYNWDESIPSPHKVQCFDCNAVVASSNGGALTQWNNRKAQAPVVAEWISVDDEMPYDGVLVWVISKEGVVQDEPWELDGKVWWSRIVEEAVKLNSFVKWSPAKPPAKGV